MRSPAHAICRLAALFAATWVLGTSLSAQTTLLLTDGDASNLQAVDTTTGNTLYSTTTFSLAYPLAGHDTLWLGQRDNTGTAVEYSLATGLVTGLQATLSGVNIGTDELLDGAASSTTNFTLGWNGTGNVNVYQAAKDWSNLTLLFNTTSLGLGSDLLGITYDSASGNLWLSGDSTVYQVSLSGTLISQFALSSTQRGALAYQAATDTLWFVPNNNSLALQEYAKDGTLLGSLTVNGRSGNVWGAEFVSVPEPSTYALLAGGLAGIAWIRRRRA